MRRFPKVEDLLPHRHTMLLVDTILDVDTSNALTQATVKSDWPLVTKTQVSPIVLVELAAQTAGVCLGWTAMQSDKASAAAPKGWLVGVKRATFYVDSIALGKRIITHTENKLVADDYKEISATLTMDQETIAEIQIQVLQADKTAFSGV